MKRTTRVNIAGPCPPCFLGLLLVLLGTQNSGAQQPIDFHSQIQPILDASCGGMLCHLTQEASGVDLRSYQSTVASVGAQYGRPIVVPFDSATSPLWLKLVGNPPEFGLRMPRNLPPLEEAFRDLIARWIDEGAREFDVVYLRGEFDGDGVVDISDVIKLLTFLFRGGDGPPCDPVADANADGVTDLSDAVTILVSLFLGGPALPELSTEEQIRCNKVNQPPQIEPIGTVESREGLPLEFQVFAEDPDEDPIEFTVDFGPDGLAFDTDSGVGTWTPGFGKAGDHRIVVRVTDNGGLFATTTGLIRVRQGNRPPSLPEMEIIYGRELVPVVLTIEAEDADGDGMTFEVIEAPPESTLNTTGMFHWVPSRGQAGDHTLRLRVIDDGEPTGSTEGAVSFIIVESDSPLNQQPTLPERAVYRSYPGLEIGLAVDARDPDGQALTYAASALPDGASLDTTTGILSWTPAADQLGPFHIPVTVTDGGTPPATAETILVLKILPPDTCVEPNCNQATGCAPSQIPLEQSCCTDEPRERVAEPVAGCPGGRVLFVGRNRHGFGRLQNCDPLQVHFAGQGGIDVRIHVETRCLRTDEPVLVIASLITQNGFGENTTVFQEEVEVELQVRNDGFAQARDIIFDIDVLALPFGFQDQEAFLSIRVIDADNVSVSEDVRVILTRNFSSDLPDPDVEDVPASEVGCIGCHRPLTPTGERHGIEDAHPWHPLSCTDCHGGNPEAFTRQEAHVATGESDPEFLRDLASDKLDAVSLEYLRFVNPGDLRVANRGCGSQNSAAGAAGCHQRTVDSVRLSVMSTYAGHYMLPRYLAGTQERTAIFGAVDVENPAFDPKTAPPGAIGFLEALREPSPDAPRDSLGTCIDVYIPKACPTCHLSDFGRNDANGNFRSSGCTACHMLYDDDGLSRSNDPVINKDFPPHAIRHQLTTAIPTEQCAHCHFQGGRIGLAFQGIREGGFSPEKTPVNGVTLGVPLHAHGPDYYFSDEDGANNHDETPPDVHFSAGMDCADCHIGGDVHGDGNLYLSEHYQVGIRCEDCHGTVRAEVAEDPEDGLFKNSKGFPLKHLRRDEENRILLGLHNEEKELVIPQIYRLLSSGVNHAMTEAMGVNHNGFSHTEKLECYTCHTSWRQTCFGCHISIDDSTSQTNQTTGEVSRGGISARRDDYSLDFFTLGVNTKGKITPLCSSMSVFLSYRDENGVERYTDRVRTTSDGRIGFGWNPFHHHTVSRVPQNCDQCHPVADGAGPDNSATLRETYGFGNGKFTSVDGDGVVHDLSAFLDESGNLISDFPHANTGPVPTAVRERALSIPVVPHPRN